MSIIDRVKNICLTPTTEWAVIASEPGLTRSLIGRAIVSSLDIKKLESMKDLGAQK